MKNIWRLWHAVARCDLHIDVKGMFTMIVEGHEARSLEDNEFHVGGMDLGDIPEFARVFCTNCMMPSIPDGWKNSPGWGFELGRDLCLSNPKGP